MKTLLRNRAASSLLTDLRMEDASGFKNFTRMSATDFEFLLNLIGARLTRQDTNYRKCITVTEKLAVTLRFLATGDSFQSLMYLFRISKQSISKFVPETCQALTDALKDTIKVNIFFFIFTIQLSIK